ncbi:MAG: TolC family protein [Candidatus Marinimicrobia bacterium]|nr:TolC family protein [Candidatus Neomarinimicrobiota bacterium]
MTRISVIPVNIISAVLLSLSIFATQLSGQDVLNLEGAVQIGIENNYSILLAKNDAEIAENNNSAGNAGFLPRVNATGSQSGSVTSSEQEFLTGQTNNRDNARAQNTNAGATLTWTIFDGFQMFATKSRLSELESQGELNVRAALENTVSDIVQSYYDIVRQQLQLAVLQDALDISSDRIEIAQMRLDLGSASGLELLQARADYNSDRSAYLRQEVVVQNAKTSLNEILSRDLATEFVIPDSLIQLKSSMDKEQLLTQVQQKNTQLQRAENSQTIAEYNLRQIQGERYPNIDLNLGYNYRRSESEAGFLKTNKSVGYDYGVSASMGLFNGFNLNRRAQNAKIMLRNSEFEYLDTENRVLSSLQQAYENYRINLQLVALEQENIQVARQTLEVAQERYQLGTINAVELKEAQRTYIAAESRLVDSQYQAKIYETELLRLSGQIGESFR